MSAQPVPIAVTPTVVKITVANNQISVAPSDVTIDRINGDTVRWECNRNDFLVCFGSTSPFDEYHFHTANPHSKGVRPGAKSGTYKYSIEVPGLPPLDPTVIVKP